MVIVAAALPFLLAAISQTAPSVRGHDSYHQSCIEAIDAKGNREQREFDLAGHLLRVGVPEHYAYRPDGSLIAASNGTAAVTFERDLLGRIVKELQGQDSVESTFDLLGLRARMKTSKGHLLEIERNVVGDVVGIKAGGGPVATGAETTAEAPLPPWEARFTRDQLGLEVERTLPGGVRARWERDNLGRPLKHEIWSGTTLVSAKAYTWEPNDRLKMIVDALNGPVQYRHDGLGNLIGAAYADDKFDLRMPDAVGNLFKTINKKDRKYGPAGQLLQSKGPDGITKYEYDPEGNLAKKILPDGKEWTYAWNGTGMLAKVVRPDGKTVEFGYDALGRRVWKKYGAKTTKWIWDGNVPVHEWVEVDPSVAEAQGPALIEAKDAGLRQRAIDLANISPQGPPPSGLPSVADDPITWVFEPESFAPLAKLTATGRYGIVTDHLGTPTAMLDEQGQTAWSADISVFGELRNVVGEKSACPFRWPGQYEDEETGLYYNRFRYYDPEAGTYVSQDPIGLRGGLQLHGYVRDPLRAFDGLGLSPSCVPPEAEPEAISRKNAFRLLRSRGLSEKEARNIVNSFEGQIYMSKGKKGDVFVITGTAPGSASGVFVTRDFAGDTPSERVRNLALPTSNTAEHQGLVELTRSQTLLEGRVAPQPSWGAARTAGGWQTVTDGGRYTGATSEIL